MNASGPKRPPHHPDGTKPSEPPHRDPPNVIRHDEVWERAQEETATFRERIEASGEELLPGELIPIWASPTITFDETDKRAILFSRHAKIIQKGPQQVIVRPVPLPVNPIHNAVVLAPFLAENSGWRHLLENDDCSEPVDWDPKADQLEELRRIFDTVYNGARREARLKAIDDNLYIVYVYSPFMTRF